MRPILLAILLFSLRLSAQTTFYVSPAGNDANLGTLVQPWQTVQHALNSAVPGCTIFLMGGTYQENLTMSVSGTQANFITLKNYNNQNAIIDGSASSGLPLLHITNKSFIIVEGLEFANYSMNDAQAILIDGVCGNIKLLQNKIHNINFSSNANDIPNANTNAQPLIVYGDNATNAITDLYITGNEIYNCRTGFSEALAVNGNVDGFTIAGNFVHDNTNIGIDVIGHEGTCPNAINDVARNGVVKWNRTWNNVSAYATSAGIYLDGAANCLVENNTSYGNGSGIEVGCETVGKSASNNLVKNNLVYRNLEAGIVVGGYDYPTNSGKVDHCSITGNTIAENHLAAQTQGELVVNYTESTSFKSNLIYSSGNDLMVACDANSLSPIFDFNLYYSSSSVQFSYNSNSAGSLTAWSTFVSGDNAALNVDPLFVNSTTNNFHLLSTSPAIDMGDSTYSPAPGETDIDTMSRRQNARVDIGADEYGTAVGIQVIQPASTVFSFYENTGTEFIIHFSKQETENGMVYLYNSTGELIESKKIGKGDSIIRFNNANLAKGIYYANANRSTLNMVK